METCRLQIGGNCNRYVSTERQIVKVLSHLTVPSIAHFLRLFKKRFLFSFIQSSYRLFFICISFYVFFRKIFLKKEIFFFIPSLKPPIKNFSFLKRDFTYQKRFFYKTLYFNHIIQKYPHRILTCSY